MNKQARKTGDYKVYFATAREAFNMDTSAIDGKRESPGEFRVRRLKSIINGAEK